MTNTYFGGKSVISERLENWMEWASGQSDATRHVVLPMIQRGSVWVPHKVLDLWDTLLRGMSVGAMMAFETEAGDASRALGEKSADQTKAGDIGLIDGQQRTLSMLAGWPEGLKNPLRPIAIWVDLIDAPQGEYQFRLWATTKAQPFGYTRSSMGGQTLSKLERRQLRLANQAWEKLDPLTLWKQPDFMPWEAKFALPLAELIRNRDHLQAFIQDQLTSYKKALEARATSATDSADENEILKHFMGKLKALSTDTDLTNRIPRLEAALDNVLAYEFPVIHVRRESFANLENPSTEVNTDPPLAILFKRVGTGGEPLSNADYVYSVIKHYAPKVHNTVEALLEDQRVRAIYTPTTLVMSAVRLTMLSLNTKDGNEQKITDSARLDKAAFARLIRNHPGFIDQFHADIKENGAFSTRLKSVLDKMGYRPDFTTGLPKHALCLVPIPLLETILVWHMLKAPTPDMMEQSCLPMVRFALQGNLCCLDYAKASEVAIKALKTDKTLVDSAVFPDQALMSRLSTGEKPTAYPLPSPAALEAIEGLTITKSPDNITGLRGWSRFATTDQEKQPFVEIYKQLYKRWWNRKGGHVHPMLLWLQRDYVFSMFEEQPALAGMDEETPFDFDHILPSAQWAYWTGADKESRFINYPLMKDGKTLDDTGHWYIGNSIGNIHVLESGENRSFGDASVCIKLKKEAFVKNALIPEDDKEVWNKASGAEDSPRKWESDRALAFQCAVEKRVFALYKHFYGALFPHEQEAK